MFVFDPKTYIFGLKTNVFDPQTYVFGLFFVCFVSFASFINFREIPHIRFWRYNFRIYGVYRINEQTKLAKHKNVGKNPFALP